MTPTIAPSDLLSTSPSSSINGDYVFDLRSVPWSRYGTYMAITTNVATMDHPGRNHEIDPGIYLTDVSGSRLWRDCAYSWSASVYSVFSDQSHIFGNQPVLEHKRSVNKGTSVGLPEADYHPHQDK